MADNTDSKLFTKVAHRLHEKVTNEGMKSLSPDERVVILIWYTQGTVGNGGFACFYQTELTPDLLPSEVLNPFDAADAYEKIGLAQAARACRESAEVFPDRTPPADAIGRRQFIRDLASVEPVSVWERSDAVLNRLERRDLDEKAAEFIRSHGLARAKK